MYLCFKVEADDLAKQLQEPFTPDDAIMFGPQSILALDHSQMISHSKESLSFDEVLFKFTCSSLEDVFYNLSQSGHSKWQQALCNTQGREKKEKRLHIKI